MAELHFSSEKFKDVYLVVATPMYGGQCYGTYVEGLLKLQESMLKYGIKHKFTFMYNESLITRARSFLTQSFIKDADATHLLFIDADIGFNPEDILAMLTIAIDDPDNKSIVCAPYTKKDINWHAVKKAVDLGYADQDARELNKFIGNYVFNVLPGTTEVDLAEPFEVLESGTGMMLIQRRVFTDFDKAYPELVFMPNSPPQYPSGPGNEIMMYFDTVIDPKDKQYLSEDYMFCRYARKLGHKVWLCGWIGLTHVGTHQYKASLQDLARLNQVARKAVPTNAPLPILVDSIDVNPLASPKKSHVLSAKFKKVR